MGPTASGKTELAAHLAATMDGEVISADSRQVYRRMDIGTGKDLADYSVDGKLVPYHLIDICEPGTKYNLFQYQQDFLKAYEDITARGRQPILCGGTGLYIESVLKGYALSPVPQNPTLRADLEGKSLEELYIIIGVNIDREHRREKITRRLKARLDEGMVEEIRGLLDSGIAAEDLTYYGLEYKYVTEYVIGKTSYEEMYRGLEIAIHQFAKRQMTWFRGMERRGFTIHWIDALQPMEEKIGEILQILKLEPET